VTLPFSLDQLVIAALILVTLGGGYALACIGWPFAHCRHCHGAGHLRAPLGRGLRLCRRCHATGRRLRLGRRLWNRYQRLRRDGAP
jgi:hypothetical protein